MAWTVICQSLSLCQGPALFTSIEVADKSNAEHSSKDRMTNTHQGMEMELIKKQNMEGLREIRVTWCTWITEPVALNLWDIGSWSCRDYFQKVERKMIQLTTDMLVLPEQYKSFETNLREKEKLKNIQKNGYEVKYNWGCQR